MRLKHILKHAVAGVKASLREAIVAANRPPKKHFYEGWNLHPDVEASFAAAVAPRPRQAHKAALRKKFPSTSRGRNWFPRFAHGVLMRNKDTGLERIMPGVGYWMDDKGTIRRAQAMPTAC